MDFLRIYGDFNQVREGGLVWIGSPEAWAGHRIDDQLREGLRVIVDDGEIEAEAVLHFDGKAWLARLIPGTGRKSTRRHPPK